MVNFHSNSLESAFMRLTFATPSTQVLGIKDSSPSEEMNSEKGLTVSLKRRISSEHTPLSNKIHIQGNTSPTLINCRNFKITKMCNKILHQYSIDKVSQWEDQRESPPFYGFDNSEKYSINETIEYETENDERGKKKKIQDKNSYKLGRVQNSDNIRKNGNLWRENESRKQKLLQEQADLELAKKLQEEYDRYAHYTRSSRKVGRGSIHRQTTLDQIFTGTYKVK